jgi:streptomycin 6-kinase
MERVVPGNQMWEVKDIHKRARLFAELVKGLPVPWDGVYPFPTYRTWMEELRCTLIALGGREKALFYLDEALSVYDGLKRKYNRKYLLHGDLHQENMLLNTKGGYTVIDPKGVVDDPVMETARYLMNECESEKIENPYEAERLIEIIGIISSIIEVPETDIIKSMFIDAALGQCWMIDTPFDDENEFAVQKQKVLDVCSFVYELL